MADSGYEGEVRTSLSGIDVRTSPLRIDAFAPPHPEFVPAQTPADPARLSRGRLSAAKRPASAIRTPRPAARARPWEESLPLIQQAPARVDFAWTAHPRTGRRRVPAERRAAPTPGCERSDGGWERLPRRS
ncbi:hypothetical protein ACO0M4_31300 [Streptomyces sp. RGM 3693]|uniref:hypothetical protein n=1 Tax=Streptomyces sp. RGM 3693 TaxID=3413284 RepID=UPI003D277460